MCVYYGWDGIKIKEETKMAWSYSCLFDYVIVVYGYTHTHTLPSLERRVETSKFILK